MPTTVATIVKTLRRARSGLTIAAPFAAPATRFKTAVPVFAIGLPLGFVPRMPLLVPISTHRDAG
jgi:hypothetical protein